MPHEYKGNCLTERYNQFSLFYVLIEKCDKTSQSCLPCIAIATFEPHDDPVPCDLSCVLLVAMVTTRLEVEAGRPVFQAGWRNECDSILRKLVGIQ